MFNKNFFILNMKKMIILFLVILLWTPSCALFHLDKLEDEHRRSCGPEALNDVLNCIKGVDWEELNLKKSEQIKLKNLSKEVISKEIRKNGDISRILLGSFNQNAFEITWPSEIETYLESKNIKFKNYVCVNDDCPYNADQIAEESIFLKLEDTYFPFWYGIGIGFVF